MKTIAVVDLVSPYGHRDINAFIVDAIAEFAIVIFCAAENYLPQTKKSNITYIGIAPEFYKITSSPLKTRWGYYKAIKATLQALHKHHYDGVLVVTYDTVSLSVFSLLHRYSINKKFHNAILMNHNNVDELSKSSIKRALFNFLPKHFVFSNYEEYISDFVKQKLGKKVITIPHNLNHYKLLMTPSQRFVQEVNAFWSPKCICVFLPSIASVSPEVLNSIYDSLSCSCYDGSIKIIGRGYSNVRSKFLWLNENGYTDEEYAYLMHMADFILMPYSESSFKYRVSGVFYDALTFSKPIIYTPSPFFKCLINKFGKIGIGITPQTDIVQIEEMIRYFDLSEVKRSLIQMQNYYSDEKVTELLKYHLTLNEKSEA